MKGMKTHLLKFFSISIFCILLIITVWLAMEVVQEQKIAEQKTENPYIEKEPIMTNEDENQVKEEPTIEEPQETENNPQKEEIEEPQVIEPPQNQMAQQYKGYAVEAKLEIPAIQLETYVIKPYSTQTLNVSVTKFWGANANQVGNFCVAGHNFQNKMMFHNLKKLKIGDAIYVTDQQNQKLAYQIFDIYTVFPKDVSCLSQKTGGKKEITLITCTMDSQKRIVVKGNAI